MAKQKTTFHSLQAKFVLRDDRTPSIFYRNRKWSLNITVGDPKEFDVSTGKLTSFYRGLDKDAVNHTIQQRYQLFNRLITEAKSKGVDSLDYIDTYLAEEQRKLQDLKLDVNTKISDGFLKWLEHKGYRGKVKSNRSHDRYDSEYSRLKDFETKNKTKLGGLNMKWIEAFAEFLATPYEKTYEKKNELYGHEYTTTNTFSQTNATIQRSLQDIVSFLKYTSEGQPDLKFDLAEMRKYLKSLPVAHDDIDNITVLSRKQWQDYKDFTPNPKLSHESRSYDLFRFCCNVGLRYSDAIRMNDDYVFIDEDGNEIIKLKAQKTRGKCEIVMNEDALRIYNKYGRDFRGKFATSQQINKNMRKIWKQIPSFCVTVIDYIYVLKELKEVKKPFYEKLSFHDSRKSFVSWIIMYNKGGDALQQVVKFVGWTDMRTIKHYLNVFGNDTTKSDKQTLSMI